jgi:hypothetical protein
MRQPERDRKTGQAEHNRQNMLDRTHRQSKTKGEDIQDTAAWTGQPRQDSLDRTAKKEQT